MSWDRDELINRLRWAHENNCQAFLSSEDLAYLLAAVAASHPPRPSISPEEIADLEQKCLQLRGLVRREAVITAGGRDVDEIVKGRIPTTRVELALPLVETLIATVKLALFPASGAPTLNQNQGAVSREEIAEICRDHLVGKGKSEAIAEALLAILSPPVGDQGQDSSRAVPDQSSNEQMIAELCEVVKSFVAWWDDDHDAVPPAFPEQARAALNKIQAREAPK